MTVIVEEPLCIPASQYMMLELTLMTERSGPAKAYLQLLEMFPLSTRRQRLGALEFIYKAMWDDWEKRIDATCNETGTL